MSAAIPERPVLLRQRDQLAVRVGARGPPRVDQQHQREQAHHLAVVGKQPPHHPRQPDRLVRQLGPEQRAPRAARVPLVEDEVEDVEDAPPAGFLLLAGRHPERHRRRLDALLGPRDPLRHRRLVDHERARDLGRRQPADGTQRQGDRRGRRQRRMAAHEQHGQRVVLVRHLEAGRLPQGGDRLPVPAGLLAPPLVDQPSLGGLDQPAARAGRDAVPRPVHGRREQRLLDGILGGVEVAVPAGEHAEDLRRELAQQGLDVGLACQRTPPRLTALARGSAARARTPSGPGTAEYLAAISIARSSDSTSTIM